MIVGRKSAVVAGVVTLMLGGWDNSGIRVEKVTTASQSKPKNV
jgi:hypothetical protein